jgi:hypothetical protein
VKLLEHFDNFLRDVVNLNNTRIATLEQRVDTIGTFLRNSDYGATIRSFSPQGSWAHKTIIRPRPEQGFDADLVMYVRPKNTWSAADYVEDLYRVFRNHGTYKDKVGRNTRCVMIDYAGDFSLDVVPVVVRELFLLAPTFEICNRLTDQYEPTAPQAYTAWLEEKNCIVGSNHLRKITRLVKYLRDIKRTFSVKSVLLTTLLGNQISILDTLSDNFPDTPTALKTLVGRLDVWLQARPTMPTVTNPVLSTEHFNRHWDQAKYENFREKIHQYREWIDDAYAEPDRDVSIQKWRRVFGEDFAKGEVVEKAATAVARVLHETAATDMVLAVSRRGPGILNRISPRLPHVEASPWKMARNTYTVVVRASESHTRNGPAVRDIASGTIVAKRREIQYRALQANGLPFPSNEYDVHWRVVNTDKEAAQRSQLRGGFYRSDAPGVRWESTLYRGAHWVEAFVVLRRTRTVIGKSDRFFVVIE